MVVEKTSKAYLIVNCNEFPGSSDRFGSPSPLHVCSEEAAGTVSGG